MSIYVKLYMYKYFNELLMCKLRTVWEGSLM